MAIDPNDPLRGGEGRLTRINQANQWLLDRIRRNQVQPHFNAPLSGSGSQAGSSSGRGLAFGCLAVVALIAFGLWLLLS